MNSIVDRGYATVLIPLDDDARALLSDYTKARGCIFTPFQSNQVKVEGIPSMASAIDHVSTGGRKALMGAMMSIGIIGGQGVAYAGLPPMGGK